MRDPSSGFEPSVSLENNSSLGEADHRRQGHRSGGENNIKTAVLSCFLTRNPEMSGIETSLLLFVLQSQNAYSFIWIASDLVSLAVVVGIFCFQK